MTQNLHLTGITIKLDYKTPRHFTNSFSSGNLYTVQKSLIQRFDDNTCSYQKMENNIQNMGSTYIINIFIITMCAIYCKYLAVVAIILTLLFNMSSRYEFVLIQKQSKTGYLLSDNGSSYSHGKVYSTLTSIETNTDKVYRSIL